MSKKTTGEFEMTYEEKRLWIQANIDKNLANHYEAMAKEYREKAERSEFGLWSHIRQTREIPVHGTMSIQKDHIMIIDNDRKAKESYLKDKMPRKAPTKEH